MYPTLGPGIEELTNFASCLVLSPFPSLGECSATVKVQEAAPSGKPLGTSETVDFFTAPRDETGSLGSSTSEQRGRKPL